ncbi:MAG: GNAT family N-acetyltransferase [Chryseobacterium sp.]|nr:MAG: GNAT family N-acetyltransferase [Chryseobacterium sp.]
MIDWHLKSFDELSRDRLYAIMRVRQEVFIVEQKTFYLDADDTDQTALHLWAEVDGEIAAYCRLFGPRIKYEECSIGRVLTHPKYRGKGLGRSMMILALEAIQTRFGTAKVRISAQDYLLGFYGDFGFESTGKRYLEDDLPHTEMLRTTDKK